MELWIMNYEFEFFDRLLGIIFSSSSKNLKKQLDNPMIRMYVNKIRFKNL